MASIADVVMELEADDSFRDENKDQDYWLVPVLLNDKVHKIHMNRLSFIPEDNSNCKTLRTDATFSSETWYLDRRRIKDAIGDEQLVKIVTLSGTIRSGAKRIPVRYASTYVPNRDFLLLRRGDIVTLNATLSVHHKDPKAFIRDLVDRMSKDETGRGGGGDETQRLSEGDQQALIESLSYGSNLVREAIVRNSFTLQQDIPLSVKPQDMIVIQGSPVSSENEVVELAVPAGALFDVVDTQVWSDENTPKDAVVADSLPFLLEVGPAVCMSVPETAATSFGGGGGGGGVQEQRIGGFLTSIFKPVTKLVGKLGKKAIAKGKALKKSTAGARKGAAQLGKETATAGAVSGAETGARVLVEGIAGTGSGKEGETAKPTNDTDVTDEDEDEDEDEEENKEDDKEPSSSK